MLQPHFQSLKSINKKIEDLWGISTIIKNDFGLFATHFLTNSNRTKIDSDSNLQ